MMYGEDTWESGFSKWTRDCDGILGHEVTLS